MTSPLCSFGPMGEILVSSEGNSSCKFWIGPPFYREDDERRMDPRLKLAGTTAIQPLHERTTSLSEGHGEVGVGVAITGVIGI